MAFFKCKGKVVYRWQKWNAQPQYGEATQWIGSGSRQYKDYPYWYQCYGKATSYTFDVNSGYFTLSGGQGFGFSSVVTTVAYNGQYVSMPDYFNVSPIIFQGAGSGWIEMSASTIEFDCNTVKRYSYHSGYIKGGTQYGEVTSTDKNAYPENGRNADDGYWYVRV